MVTERVIILFNTDVLVNTGYVGHSHEVEHLQTSVFFGEHPPSRCDVQDFPFGFPIPLRHQYIVLYTPSVSIRFC